MTGFTVLQRVGTATERCLFESLVEDVGRVKVVLELIVELISREFLEEVNDRVSVRTVVVSNASQGLLLVSVVMDFNAK